LILVVLAVWQWQVAEEQRRTALSRQLAAQAIPLISQGLLDRALLLTQEALRLSETTEAHDALLTALQYSPRLTTFLRAHGNSVYSIAFSPDGKMLASGGKDGSVILWDLQKGQQLGEPLMGHDESVRDVAFSPDGKMLASKGEDESALLWYVDTELWKARACFIANRNLTHLEWAQYLENENEPYRKTCPNVPEGR